MTRVKKFLLAFVVSLGGFMSLSARDGLFVLPSLDEKGDSLAVMAMRERMAEIRKTRPTVGLVLAGGGAKGAAHVGVLRFLEEQGIPIDLITGTSMGGLVGGLYALGYSSKELDSLLTAMDWSVMMSDRVPQSYINYQDKKFKDTYNLSIPWYYEKEVWRKRLASGLPQPETGQMGVNDPFAIFRAGLPDGYLNGLNVHNTLSAMTVGYQDSLEFRNLPIPFFCVATDLVSCKEKNQVRGDLVDALRSTMSIPFVFKPLRKDGMVLIDGGMRNNMPVDLCRAMGADIVIAVDLSQSSESEKNVNTVFDVMMQSVNMMSQETYDANIQNIDVYLHPDMFGYNMLSFSKDNIADIIRRGYTEAAEHAMEIQQVALKTGAVGTTLKARPATDMGREGIYFSEIEFKGLDPYETRFFQDKMKIGLGRPYKKSDLEAVVAEIYATGCYETVTWKVLGTQEPYKLEITCSPGPVHHFGLGLRADTEEIVALALNGGLGVHRLYGSRFDASFKIGLNPYARFEYAYRFLKGPQLSLALETRYADFDSHNRSYLESRDDSQEDRYRFWTNDLTFLVRSGRSPYFDVYAGMNAGNIPYYNFRGFSKRDWNVHYMALGHFAFDNRDDRYFPQNGVCVQADYQFVFGNHSFNQSAAEGIAQDGFSPYHIASFSVKDAASIGPYFTLLTSFDFRFVSKGYDNILFIHRNYAGGFVPGRMVSHHIPFCCINGVNQFERIITAADVDFRVRFLTKNYVTFSVCTLHQANAFRDFTYKTTNNAFAFGFALQYSRKTFMGPLRAALNWNSIDRTVGVYVGVGYDF
ncbi:MAG: patatin-like phospholipase family protein [Bacteroidales bacterium]|nr:patatin-like phospholipase family protein [Bacteroidales bacterium]